MRKKEKQAIIVRFPSYILAMVRAKAIQQK